MSRRFKPNHIWFTKRFTIYLDEVYETVYNDHMDKYDQIIQRQLNEAYYDPRELKYGTKAKTFLSSFDLETLTKRKMEILSQGKDERFVKLDLLAWNSKPLFYLIPNELSSMQASLLELSSSFELSGFAKEAMEHSLLYSEIEGSLSIEDVPTARKRMIELIQKGAKPLNRNDVIVKNMSQGIDFLFTKPAFNEENLSALYSMLSQDCLDEEDELLEGSLYRHDEVEIDHYYGCPHQKIKQCMDSLFSFVNANLDNPKLKYVLPHIAHYYLVYVHPYFDYNGRTARMVSLWLHLLTDNLSPSFISEGIDLKKKDYYLALENTRDTQNDLTYFLEFVFKTSIDYFLCYKNLETITQSLKDAGITWTESEFAYFKKILLSYKGKFTYSDFLAFSKAEMSKQGALKILNRFVSYGLLSTDSSRSKAKLFDVEKDRLPYWMSNFRP